MVTKITVNPITRLEGHGKIDIFLDDKGNVADAFWQVVELRGFERFCIGRPVEEMPRIVANVCGVCPTPHNMAATKALDKIYSVEPTPAAKLVRQLHYNAFYVEDHLVHFFFLSAPDFIVGPNSDPAVRNILGVLKNAGADIVNQVIDIRKRNRDIIRLVGSKAPHPEGGLPGGVSRGVTEEERKWIKKTAVDTVEFSKFAIQLFKDVVLKNKSNLDLVLNDAYKLDTYYMGMVDDKNRVSFYDGTLRVVDSKGKEFARFDPCDYLDHIAEWVEPWTYVRLTYLKKLGWNGLKDGPGTSLYRVGPLARLNVADGMATPLAHKEYEAMFDILGGKPASHTLAYHWARLIETLQAAETLVQIANDPQLTSKDIRNMNLKLKKEGVGAIEAARGTLFHHYKTDDRGIMTEANLLVATQHNAAPICLSVKKAAQGFVKGPDIKEGMLNMVEMAFRAYDPCLSCATHSLPGQMQLTVNIRNPRGELLNSVSRF
ncbi:MAG: Ni/Fe hydrogenase subunit alpha [Dehalococcoidales bacterium]|nr:Ni/Fe hydrogenase subunit alpha [Dehalococcoidales bacterium]